MSESAPLRLAAYAGLLLVTFALAWLAGAWAGPIKTQDAVRPDHANPGHEIGEPS